MMNQRFLQPTDFDLSFKVFHELMAKKVADILLVSSPYDAFIMEEEGRLAERIIHEYRGLNLSRPPMLSWVSSAREALDILAQKKFDLVITMPQVDETDAYELGRQIKTRFPDLPVFLMIQNTSRHLLDRQDTDRTFIDRTYVWFGNSDLLLALIKNLEDRLNVAYDTQRAWVRVIIIVEDSPIYYSSLLPLLYKEIVSQTQAVMEESLNDEHRILRMRARPKILVAQTYEEAIDLYQKYKPYLLSVFSDVRFPKSDKLDDEAGFKLLSKIRQDNPDLPLLNFSSEESNRAQAQNIPAVFLNKNSGTLHSEIRSFFMQYLGFGDFIFRLPDGKKIDKASDLREMEKILPTVPDESVFYHATRNHFSSWLMARSEIMLASKLKPVKISDFKSVHEAKQYLVSIIRDRRMGRQKGIISEFDADRFDPDTDFSKIGKGSLGGKARGLAFMSTRLKNQPEIHEKFKDVTITVPKTLVISTEGFDAFISENNLGEVATGDDSDPEIIRLFANARMPAMLERDLHHYLKHARYPLAVRSSSLLEDAQFQPFAGIYKTYMIPNNDDDFAVRYKQLTLAIKLVYASTYCESARAYVKSTFHRTEDEKMGVVIQQLTGEAYGQHFYPAISGVAQSYNYYPISYLKPDDGLAHIALGLGRIVVEGGAAMRFSPRYPQFLPQFSTVDDILENAQRFFYALNLNGFPEDLLTNEDATLEKLDIDSAMHDAPVRLLCSTYSAQDHRIRDGVQASGYPVCTFASILKYDALPLAEILTEILAMGRQGMGCPVEIEFAVNMPLDADQKPIFELLQIRPMAVNQSNLSVEIRDDDISKAFCYSTMALGNGQFEEIRDIIFVHPDRFDAAKTVQIASEIAQVNKEMRRRNQKYLLIGPGRWGSADRWLGIPVRWPDISGVGAIVETTIEGLKADPSQGSHFFHNITSLGISYLNTSEGGKDFINWEWLMSLPAEAETPHLRHVSVEKPLLLKIDGKESKGVIIP
ncbi:MAG: PEP/pyruvate-binding domain-containing protein [Desulfobacterales bacterium]|nr:PEP/pyruvate-binding domain-containing protein [Desulfobacterales bacterium]